MSSISQLNSRAQQEVPPIKASNSPPEYFQLAAGYLKQAGSYKRQGDLAGAYVNVKKYMILILERLPSHPSINKPEYKEEYYYNREKTNTLQAELNNLASQLEAKLPPPPATGQRNLPPPPPTASPGQNSSSTNSSITSGFSSMMSWFGGSSKTSKPTPPPTQNLPPAPTRSATNPQQINLPPPPSAGGTVSKPMTAQEKFMYNQMEKVVMNEKVQSRVGEGVARMAQNEELQGKVADSVAKTATNKSFQKSVGTAIASNTDNAFVKTLATNEKVQGAVGTAFAKTVGNKEVQKKVGSAIATAATDRETQKKVASGLLTLGKYAWSGTKVAGKAAVKGGALAVTTGVAVYNEMEKQKAEEKLKEQAGNH